MRMLLLALLLCPLAQADYRNGTINFSESEIREHQAGLPLIMEKAAACLEQDLKTHNSFFRQWGISPYYGDQSAFAKADGAGRRKMLAAFGFDSARIEFLMKTLQPTSCIGLTLRCMGQGFAAAGQEKTWEKLKKFTKDNGVEGGALQAGLQKLGWKLFYWNPNVAASARWDEEEKVNYKDNPKKIWGYHLYNWQTVSTKQKYLYNKVDDFRTLVNFGSEVPSAVKNVPFFVGVAHMGYHVFPGSFGQIIEGHSTRKLNDPQTVETSPFNPLAKGGGPRGNYYSGLIALPPGYGH